MKNMVFIIGTGRCGSTFVHEILAKHVSMGFVSNIEDNFSLINKYGRWNNALYRTVLGRKTKKGGLRFAPSEAYSLISKEVSPIYANSNRDLIGEDVSPWLRDRFINFFETRYKIQKKLIFSHKYTGWSRISFFQEIFPEAKFIHIVRDGRAVANSWLQMPWWGGYRGPENWLWGELPEDYFNEWRSRGCSYPHLAAISWKILMESFELAEQKMDSNNYLRVRYEDILESPRVWFKEMLSFSGLKWNREFERAFSKLIIKKNRSRAFEHDLTPAQLSKIEDSLSDMLSRYGYE